VPRAGFPLSVGPFSSLVRSVRAAFPHLPSHLTLLIAQRPAFLPVRPSWPQPRASTSVSPTFPQ